ncbi:hypothetical protein DH2020_040030 [Rehmannia glutinosa]|uniref:Heparan-alpha-glucosaminide N-acetyltransferase catalytic domain-containing protein n=1 Tax=Rehmannia glutinosa TaxID=99300 RepID=A0ABR0UVA9_REHGL
MEDFRKVEEGFGNSTKLVTEDNGHQQKKVAEDIAYDKINDNEQNDEQPIMIKQKTKRVATLDAFRGLTIVLMILVDDAGGAYPKIDHSPWNGCTLADFVLPFFLFIVGVAIALALKKIPEVKYAIRKIILRTLKLIFWGILLQGGYSHAPDNLTYGVDMKHIRWCGILQRIALVYFVVALVETLTTKFRPTGLKSGPFSIFTAYKWQWIGGFVAFVIYMVTTFSLFVPDWSFTVRQDDTAERYTLDFSHRYWYYRDPLWTRLDSFQAIPINKQLYSFSYVCFTAGAAGIVFSVLYILIDVWGLRTPFLFLEWIGMNAMLVFVMAAQGIFAAFINGWYFKNPDNNLVSTSNENL